MSGRMVLIYRIRVLVGLIRLPRRFDGWIRTWMLRKRGMTVLTRAIIRFPFNYRHPEHITIGEGAVVGEYGFLVAGPNSRITIGKNTLLAPNVHVNTVQHNYSNPDVPINFQGSIEDDVVIGEDCWLGTGVIVLKGVTVGNGTVVGAGSVVIGDTGNFNVVAGVPARFLKKRWE